MGKSTKKPKSDRINALRKQYDAFLDEDKKRKDRNEFILGSLEKMRLYSSAVVPVRHNLGNSQVSKYHFVTQERPEYQKKIKFDERSIPGTGQTGVLPDYVIKEEQRILQEISKKYILIPKIQSTDETGVSYYYPSNISNDADWRNKYNILDELKKIEKEGSSDVSKDTGIAYDTFNNGDNDDPQSRIAAPQNIREDINSINRNPIQHNTQLKNEKIPVPELQTNSTKAVITNSPDCKTLSVNKQDSINKAVKNTDFHSELVSSAFNSINQKRFSDPNNVNEELRPREENKKLNYNHVQNIKQNDVKVTDNIVPTNTDQIFGNVNNESVTQNDTTEIHKAEIIDSSNIKMPLIENENIEQNFKTDKMIAHPVKHIENQPCVNVVVNQSENIEQQEYEPNNEMKIVHDNIVPSQIDEFEAEQKEMPYSEETGYHPNVDTIEYNTQNAEYSNEKYSYYNESQQEQPYYAETNEHEESTERYDPNYEQQYVENYEENVNAAHYKNQQYGGDGYENHQEVSNVNYEQQPGQQEITNVNYEQKPDQQVTNVNYDEQPVNYEEQPVNYEEQPVNYEEQPVNYEEQPVNYEQQPVNYEEQPVNYEEQPVNYEEQPVNYEKLPGNYEEQSGNFEEQPVNYEEQPGNYEEQPVNYEEQPGNYEEQPVNYEEQPVNYEYEQSEHMDNPLQSHILNTYVSQAGEHVNYETPQYDEVGEVEPQEQNVYESQQDYVQMHTEQETLQNLEQQLDGKEGFTETQNTFPKKSAVEVKNVNGIESNIKVT